MIHAKLVQNRPEAIWEVTDDAGQRTDVSFLHAPDTYEAPDEWEAGVLAREGSDTQQIGAVGATKREAFVYVSKRYSALTAKEPRRFPARDWPALEAALLKAGAFA